VYRIHYYCPREAPFWQVLTEGLIFKTPAVFGDFQSAVNKCDSLLWQYHSSRVVDLSGHVVYQVGNQA